ncbi:very short patch repair endonuclease [Mycolicibacillus parakoreensis]|nr:very short patch repair endonuclease [Mycolicibacillus parakoreensis]
MRAQKTSGTGIELRVRRRLHALGYRYRVDCRPLADHKFRGDIVWRGRRIAVFLDGCFWHGCPEHGTIPKSNTEWWLAKLQENRDRDRRVDTLLRQRGWRVLRFWEHDDIDDIVQTVINHLEFYTDGGLGGV